MNMDFMLMDEDDILEEVDEYLLYCFYLGYQPELRVRYKSPVRGPDNADENASWSLFHNTSRLNREYAWKDSGTGEYGDIFKLVMLILNCKNKAIAVERVKQDFLFGKGTELARQGVPPPKDVDPARIRIKSRAFDALDLEWWKARTSADKAVLEFFNTQRVQYYWMYDRQNTPRFPADRVYSYRVYDHYQLYFPHRDRDFRFRNDFTDAHVLGFRQLQYRSEILLINKSAKDIICTYGMGFESIAPRGENTKIPQTCLQFLKTRYKYIFTLFDNDGKHRAWDYDVPSIEIPIATGQKDPSDCHLAFGQEYTRELIWSLIKNHPTMNEFKDIDWTRPMDRKELEALLEEYYLNQVISIQHVSRKVKLVCGKVHRIAVEIIKDEPICIAMINDLRYEFALGYFIQKAQIHQNNGNIPTGNQPD